MVAEPQPSHSNLFLKAIQIHANPVSGLIVNIGPIYREGLWLQRVALLLRVTSSSLTKIKPIISKFTHQLFPLISLQSSTHRPTLNLLMCVSHNESYIVLVLILMEFIQWPNLHQNGPMSTTYIWCNGHQSYYSNISEHRVLDLLPLELVFEPRVKVPSLNPKT